MDNGARHAFIVAGVGGLSLTSDEKAALVYQLSCVPSVSVDESGTVSFTAKAIAMAPDLSPTSQTGPVFDGG